MSINRKKRLRKLAGAVLGAASLMPAGAANSTPTNALETNAGNNVSNWNKVVGVGSLLTGGAMAAAAVYNTFKGDKEDQRRESELRRMEYDAKMKQIKDEEAERVKKEKIAKAKSEAGLNDAALTNIKNNLDAILPNTAYGQNITEEMILDACVDNDVRNILVLGKADQLAATRKNLMNGIRDYIGNNVTTTRVNKAMDALSKRKEDGTLEAYEKVVARGLQDGQGNTIPTLPKTAREVTVTSAYANGPADIAKMGTNAAAGGGWSIVGNGVAPVKVQYEAGDELMPEPLKVLLKGRLAVSPIAELLATSGKGTGLRVAAGHLNLRNTVLKAWDNRDVAANDCSYIKCRASKRMAMNGFMSADLMLGGANCDSANGNDLNAVSMFDTFKEKNKLSANDLREINAKIHNTTYLLINGDHA